MEHSIDTLETGRLAELDVTGGLVTRFQYVGAAMIAETDAAGDVMRRYVHGPCMDAPMVRYDYTSAGALEGRRWLLSDPRRIKLPPDSRFGWMKDGGHVSSTAICRKRIVAGRACYALDGVS